MPLYDAFWSVFTVLLCMLTLGALISLGRRRGTISGSAFALWLLVIVLVPLFGPLLWLVASSKASGDEVARVRRTPPPQPREEVS